MTTLVVIPTYNERENIPILIPAILQQGDFRVLIVDDSSPDGTGDVADQLAREYQGRVEVLHRTGPRNFRRSYVDGFLRALSQDVDLICQMDADLSHNPQYLPELVKAAEEYDVVLGSRYLDGITVRDWSLYRLGLSVAANRYVRLITRLPTKDCTSGFRCWHREVLGKLHLERLVSNGYAFQVETLFEAASHRYRIHEIPIVFVERRHGKSKLSGHMLYESALMPWRLVLRRLFRQRS